MRLRHYSHKPMTEVINRAGQLTPGDKPKGLWVSVVGRYDWKAWTEAENTRLGKIVYDVDLARPNNVLVLPSCRAVVEFNDAFACVPAWSTKENYRCSINWPAVAQIHSGIIIAPYQWDLRLSDRTPWYYGWDCASGCIWDDTAIRSVNLVAGLNEEAA